MNTREKGTEIGQKNETRDLLREILDPWIPPEKKKKKKRFPPKFVAVKKETNENKELKDKNKHEAIGSIKKKKDMKP